MRTVRFEKDGNISYGISEGKVVKEIGDAPWLRRKETGRAYEINEVRLLAPCSPSKVVAVGLNYSESFDTFCPIGPWIETELDPSRREISLRVNGETRQQSNTENLIFPVPELVSFVSRVMTLFPGDVVATGTPPGVGPVRVGDVVEVEIEGIGILTNPVVTGKQ